MIRSSRQSRLSSAVGWSHGRDLLELVDETEEQEINLDALHDALMALLIGRCPAGIPDTRTHAG